MYKQQLTKSGENKLSKETGASPNHATNTYVKKRSDKIYIISFLMMLGIVITHSRLPRWDYVPDYFMQLALINELGEDCVSAFFLITGFLFFRRFTMADYLAKLRTRFNSLVVPYLLWNIIGAISWYIVITLTGHRYVSDNFEYSSPIDIAGKILASYYTILWYVGVIIVYAVAAPIFHWCLLKKKRSVGAIIVFFVIGSVFHHPFSSPILWMSLYMMGAYLGVYHQDYLYRPQPITITIVALVMFPIFVWLNHTYDNMLTINLRAWTAAFFYIGLYDIINSAFHFRSYKIYKYAFFLYASHYILVHVLIRYIINLGLESTTHWSITIACWTAYLVIPIFVIITCLTIAYLMDRYAHKIYALLSGGR